jgi:acetyltransferase
MSIRNLEHLFRPQSIAVIGASETPRSVGATVLHNLIAGKFAGAIMPVNPKHGELAGIKVYPTVASLPTVPGLAVICTPPATVPGLIGELGARGTKAAIAITAGLGMTEDSQGRTLKEAMLAAARPHLLRILGPNCVGLLVPGLGLNASFAHTSAVPGKIAFVSQSGALAPMSTRATSSITSEAMPRPTRSFSISNRSPRRASSCPRRVPQRATSR